MLYVVSSWVNENGLRLHSAFVFGYLAKRGSTAYWDGCMMYKTVLLPNDYDSPTDICCVWYVVTSISRMQARILQLINCISRTSIGLCALRIINTETRFVVAFGPFSSAAWLMAMMLINQSNDIRTLCEGFVCKCPIASVRIDTPSPSKLTPRSLWDGSNTAVV